MAVNYYYIKQIWPGLFTSRDCCSGEAAAHETVVNYREPTQPNPGCNEADAVRSARPKGKKCRLIMKLRTLIDLFILMEEINGMNYPELEINLRKLEHNARLEVQKLAKYGVTVMGVNKVFNGLSETASAIIRAGIDVVAESRVSNLKKLQHLPCQKCLLRTPSPSEIEEVVRYADISLNSEAAVFHYEILCILHFRH
jgi:hypothetical protein